MRDQILTDVQKMYDESSSSWHTTRTKKYRSTGTYNWPVTQRYLDTLQPTQRVLDVGCGDGRLVSGLPDKVEYVGIDFSRGLLKEAENNFAGRHFRYGNIVEESCWTDLGMFDAVFCVAVLHHIPEREQQVFVLRHMKEVTHQKGFLFLSVWNLWQERFLQAHLDSLELKKENERWVEVPFQKTWKRFCFQMDVPYLTEIMTEAGWDLTEIFFADHNGEKADIQTGQNLIAIAR